MKVEVFGDITALSEAAADFFIESARQHIAERGRFCVALSGGSTPRRLHELLTARATEIDWSKVWIFWGDERWITPEDPSSNENMARQTLLSHVSVPENQVFPMFDGNLSVAEAAEKYESSLRSVLGETCAIDLLLLGMGDDGHTASLFPGIPELAEEKKWVVPTISPKGVPQRLTLTYPALASAKQILFLADGADKAEPLARALGTDDSVRPPAGVLTKRSHVVTWFIDELAAANLDTKSI